MAVHHQSGSWHPQALDMNGMAGRMVRLQPPTGKTAEVLFVGDRHRTLEMWQELLIQLNRSAGVTAPELPGIGGMDSFLTIGKQPTVDTYADYLAAFMKLRFRRKRVVIVGVGFGFIVATRMLQRYPALRPHVRHIIGLQAYAHYSDERKTANRGLRLLGFRLAASWPVARMIQLLYLNRVVLPRLLAYRQATIIQRAVALDDTFITAQASLWRTNDLQTNFHISADLLRLNNCTHRLDVPLLIVVNGQDAPLDTGRAEQHLRVAYTSVASITVHTPLLPTELTITKAAARGLLPAPVRHIIAQK